MAIRSCWAWLLLGAFVAGAAGAEGGRHRGTTSSLLKAYERLRSERVETRAARDDQRDEGEQAAGVGLRTATFGTGCFWCTEAMSEELEGVKQVDSGYSGGNVPEPTYLQVCTGTTGHAEVVHLRYDPSVISYSKLLEVFWMTHDPTTLNQQGVDVGPQYRSAIFYHDDEQRKLAERYKSELDASKAFRRPIVTEVVEFKDFFVADGYHQDYYSRNGRQPYCRRYITPKLKKLRRVFREDVE